jgi:hypothetical protein
VTTFSVSSAVPSHKCAHLVAHGLVVVAGDTDDRHSEVGVGGEQLDQSRRFGVGTDHEHPTLVLTASALHRHPRTEHRTTDDEQQPRQRRTEQDVADTETQLEDAIEHDDATGEHRHGSGGASQFDDADRADSGEEEALATQREQPDDDGRGDHRCRPHDAVSAGEAHVPHHSEVPDRQGNSVASDQQQLEILSTHAIHTLPLAPEARPDAPNDASVSQEHS